MFLMDKDDKQSPYPAVMSCVTDIFALFESRCTPPDVAHTALMVSLSTSLFIHKMNADQIVTLVSRSLRRICEALEQEATVIAELERMKQEGR